MVDLLVFFLVLGLLVFFHEMGHFIAAKVCGVYVERFSLGMPPRIFGIKWGETDYCIGLTPIGGYVKMAGQEDVPTSEEEREKEYASIPKERWLDQKPRWQRAIVFAAGPFMNIVLAVLLYALVAACGEDVPASKFDNRIGAILPDSPAATAQLYKMPASGEPDFSSQPDAIGWKTGDRVLSVNGERIESIADVAFNAILGSGEKMRVEIERLGPDGQPAPFISLVEPVPLEGERHPRFGIAPFNAALVGEVLDDTPAKAAGLQPDDIIVRADGELIDSQSFSQAVSKKTGNQPVDLEIKRGDETIHIQTVPKVIGSFGAVFTPPLFSEEAAEREEQPTVIAIERRDAAGSEAKQAGIFELFRRMLQKDTEAPGKSWLLPKDQVLEIDGQPATVAALDALTLARPDATVQLKVRRPAILGGLLRPESIETFPVTLKPEGKLGIVWKTEMVFHRVPPMEIASDAIARSNQALARTVRVLGSLVTGGLGMKDLGGPVMIFRATTQARQMGLTWLIEITAFISINLAVFNLLPLPVLDGGHLMLLCVEGVRRKPVNVRIVERVQQAGLFLILGLFIFVIFNDIRTWINDVIP